MVPLGVRRDAGPEEREQVVQDGEQGQAMNSQLRCVVEGCTIPATSCAEGGLTIDLCRFHRGTAIRHEAERTYQLAADMAPTEGLKITVTDSDGNFVRNDHGAEKLNE